jgi:hypothetical protein
MSQGFRSSKRSIDALPLFPQMLFAILNCRLLSLHAVDSALYRFVEFSTVSVVWFVLMKWLS